MKRSSRLEIMLAALFLAIVAMTWAWQNPGAFGGRASQADIDRYVAAIENSQVPEPERATMIARIRTWLATDDGKPVYMLNLMRYYDELRRFPGGPTEGKPRDVNQRYEDAAMPLLLKFGGYPQYVSIAQGGNLIEGRPELDNWDRVLLVRYPSRRIVMEVFTDPRFVAIVGDKLAALSVVLTPTTPELRIPELHWLLTAILLPLWLAIGWWRSARFARASAPR